MKSGCFGLVDRGKGLQSRNLERALADSGELQVGSNIGRRQVKAADYFIVPDLVTKNANGGGFGLGGAVGGLIGGGAGALLGGLKEIGRAHVGTPGNNEHLVCRPLLEKKKNTLEQTELTSIVIEHI